MRWYIVCTDEDGPYVIAEAVDEDWARDMRVLTTAAVLNEDELQLDPELRGALVAWDGKDDRVYASFLAVMEAEGQIDTARIEAIREGLVPGPDPEDVAEAFEAMRMVHQGETSAYRLPADVQRYYEASAAVWERIDEIKRSDGDQAAAQTARMIARDLVRFAGRLGGRVI